MHPTTDNITDSGRSLTLICRSAHDHWPLLHVAQGQGGPAGRPRGLGAQARHWAGSERLHCGCCLLEVLETNDVQQLFSWGAG